MLVIAVFKVDARVHELISGLGGAVLAALCRFGIREVPAGEFHEWIHVLAACQTLRWVDRNSFNGGAADLLPALRGPR